MTTQDLKLFTNGAETYVARDAQHVLDMWAENNGRAYEADEDEGRGEWEERENKGPFTIHLDDGRGAVTQSQEDWVRDNGPGFLCSTEF